MAKRKLAPPAPAGRTEQDHLEMTSNPNRWPQLVLPLKHSRDREPYGGPKTAVLFASMADRPEFFILRDANLFRLHEDDRKPEPTTPEAVVKEGWIVD